MISVMVASSVFMSESLSHRHSTCGILVRYESDKVGRALDFGAVIC